MPIPCKKARSEPPGADSTAPTPESGVSLTGWEEEQGTDRLGYYGRLRTGRSIGSGGVESLARRMGRRLKVPGQGWCVDHLEGMAALIAIADTPEWDNLWSGPNA